MAAISKEIMSKEKIKERRHEGIAKEDKRVIRKREKKGKVARRKFLLDYNIFSGRIEAENKV